MMIISTGITLIIESVQEAEIVNAIVNIAREAEKTGNIILILPSITESIRT